MTLLIEADATAAETYRFAIAEHVTVLESLVAAHRYLDDNPDELLVVVGPDVDLAPALELASALHLGRPAAGVVLLRRRVDVGALNQVLRAGVRDVVNPDDLSGLTDACRRSLEVSRRITGTITGHGDERREGRIITVFSAKGGCGKTTMATNIAVALAGSGRRVCLVDLDLAFGDVAIALQLVPKGTIVDASQMGVGIDQHGVRSVVTSHSSGVDTICAPLEPGEAERIDVAVVTQLLGVLRSMYEVVVIDTPPAFTEHVLTSFDQSDTYVLLTTLDVPALKNLRLTLDTLDLLGYPRTAWNVVVNRADSQVGLSLEEVQKALRVPIAAQIPSSSAVPASINRGVPLVLDEPNHPVSRAIVDLVNGRLVAAADRDGASERPAASGRRRFAGLRRGGGR